MFPSPRGISETILTPARRANALSAVRERTEILSRMHSEDVQSLSDFPVYVFLLGKNGAISEVMDFATRRPVIASTAAIRASAIRLELSMESSEDRKRRRPREEEQRALQV